MTTGLVIWPVFVVYVPPQLGMPKMPTLEKINFKNVAKINLIRLYKIFEIRNTSIYYSNGNKL